VLAGVGYLVAWVVSQSVGAPTPSIAASGAQVVTSFAGRGGPNMAMFVLAEGVAAVALAVVAIAVTRPALHRAASRPGARLAARVGVGFGVAAAVVSWAELALGAWLIAAVVPDRQTGTAGAAFHALNRADGAKMFLLAVTAAALSVMAMTAPPLLPRWLPGLGFLAAATLMVSGLGYVLLAPGLGDSVYVSGVLLVAFVASIGVTFGLRDGKTDA
jgi:hypothetical protein